MAFSVISLGFCSLILQFVLLRELRISFQGNELSIGIILFCWLLGLSIGAAMGKKFLKNPSLKTLFAGLLVFNSAWFYIAVFLSRVLKPLFCATAYEIIQPLQMFYISAATIIPQTIIFGVLFVIISAILNNPVKTYYLEACGAFTAGIAGMFLVKFLNSCQIIWVISVMSVISAAAVKKKSKALIYSIIVINILMAVSGALIRLENSTNNIRFAPQQLIAYVDSIYENISVLKTKGLYSVYENGSLSFSNQDTEALEEYSSIALLSHPSPSEILLIGGGASGIIPEIAKHRVKEIDYIEQDKKLLETVIKYSPDAGSLGLASEILKIYNRDARAFVKGAGKRYDLIMLNSNGPKTLQSNRFYTLEFFREIKKLLKPGGMLALAIDSKEDILTGKLLKYNACIYKTLAYEFKYVEAAPGERMILIASNSPVNTGAEALEKRFQSRNINNKYFTARHIYAKLLRQGYVVKMLKDSAIPVNINRDLYPAGFFYYLGVSGAQSSINFGKIWGFFGNLKLIYIIPAFFIITFWRRKDIIKISVITTGFFGISAAIIISLLFQINFGFLYYRLGCIIAAFMLGLAAGSMFTEQTANAKKLFLPEILIAILSLFFCIFLRENQALYFLFAGVSGFAVGREFALFCRFYNAGSVYSLDSIGACAGSILTGLILIPVLGIYQTCLCMALVKIISILFLKKQLR